MQNISVAEPQQMLKAAYFLCSRNRSSAGMVHAAAPQYF
jgi:hypothetical protein